MKTLLFTALVLCCFVITSCSRYQVNLISSTNTNKNAQTGNFEFENDSVKISYSFFGEDAPVNVNIYNKLNSPLYIDWEKSAVIIGDNAISYASNNVGITGNLNSQTDYYRIPNSSYINTKYTTGNISAVASLPSHSTFLPPHSQGGNVNVRLTNGFLQVPDTAFKKVRMLVNSSESGLEKVNSASFDKYNSPMVFKSYLTLYLMIGNEVKPVIYQHDFYVSKSFTTLTEPQTFTGFEQKRGDYFINSRATGYTKAMTGVGVAAVVGAAGAISNSQNNSK